MDFVYNFINRTNIKAPSAPICPVSQNEWEKYISKDGLSVFYNKYGCYAIPFLPVFIELILFQNRIDSFSSFVLYYFISCPCTLVASWIIYPIIDKIFKKKTNKLLDDYGSQLRTYQYDIARMKDYYYLNDDLDLAPNINPQILSFISQIKSYISSFDKAYTKNWWENLDCYEFEREVASWYSSRGYKAIVTPKSGDGGVDVILTDSKGIKTFVQCKHYKSSKIDVHTVREFYGVMSASGIKNGIIVSITRRATDAARDFMTQNNIKHIGINELSRKKIITSDQSVVDNDSTLDIGDVSIGKRIYSDVDKIPCEIKILSNKISCDYIFVHDLFYGKGICLFFWTSNQELSLYLTKHFSYFDVPSEKKHTLKIEYDMPEYMRRKEYNRRYNRWYRYK